MAVELGAEAIRILTGRNYSHFVTLMPDGSPHVAPVWVDVEGGDVLVNTADGRVKVENVRRDPRVALSARDQADPEAYVMVRGTVVEIAEVGAQEHIDRLSRRYDGEAWEPVPGQRRLILRIRPHHVLA